MIPRLGIAVALVAVALAGCTDGFEGDSVAVICTNFGPITVELFDETPVTSQNFLDLADAEARVHVLREDALAKVEAAVALLAEGRNLRMPRDAPPELRRAGPVVAPDEPDAPRLEERAPGVRRAVRRALALRRYILYSDCAVSLLRLSASSQSPARPATEKRARVVVQLLGSSCPASPLSASARPHRKVAICPRRPWPRPQTRGSPCEWPCAAGQRVRPTANRAYPSEKAR